MIRHSLNEKMTGEVDSAKRLPGTGLELLTLHKEPAGERQVSFFNNDGD